MCLLIVAHDVDPDYRLVLAGHRDEFHARPAAPLGWWQAPADMLAGRDLQAGGTWLGVGRDGRLGVVTNFRGEGSTRPGSPSRGLLIPEFLAGDLPAVAFSERLVSRAPDYSGFNLLVFDGSALAYVGNQPQPVSRPLERGVYGLSNHLLDTPWPKLVRTRERVRSLVGDGRVSPEALFAALQDRQPAAETELPATGLDRDLERLVSAPFIVSPDYGTRCTTVLLLGRDGQVQVEERRYSPDGGTIGRTRMAFHTTRPPAPQR
jgi:uncharacterized protein with NRDE domain